MLYDPRWEERRSAGPPDRRGNAFAFLLAVFLPVFIASYTLAVSLDEILVLVVPVGLNAAGLLFARRGPVPSPRRRNSPSSR